MKSIKQVEAKLRVLEMENWAIMKRFEFLEKELERVNKEKDNAVKPIEDELHRISEPFDNQIKEMWDEKRAKEQRQYNLQREKQELIRTKTILESKQRGEMTEVAIRALLRNAGLRVQQGKDESLHSDSEYSNIKKVLENGIVVFRSKDYRYTQLWAFAKGFKLVGYWCKAVSEHPGDDVSSMAWIGTTLTRENTLEWKEHARMQKIIKKMGGNMPGEDYEKEHKYFRRTQPTGYYGYSNRRTDVTMKHFMADLEAIDPDKTPEIEFTNENKSVMAR